MNLFIIFTLICESSLGFFHHMDLVLIVCSFPALGTMYKRPARPSPRICLLDSGIRGLLRFFLGELSHNPIILSIIYCHLNIGPRVLFFITVVGTAKG